jgi:trans-aconitate 2-methyltransferase
MSTQNDIKNYYEDFSQRVHLDDFRRLNRRLEAIKVFCGAFIKEGAKVLEIGCGVGIISRHLASSASQVLSVDLSETGIDTARKFADLPSNNFLVLDVTKERERLIDHGPFDAVVVADVIEHIPPADRPALWQLIEKVLAPEGVALLTWPSPEYQEYLRVEHPESLQVVDETVELADLLAETTLIPLYYRLCDVWCHRQYAHLALAPRKSYLPAELSRSFWKRLFFRVRNRLWNWKNRSLLRTLDRRSKPS